MVLLKSFHFPFPSLAILNSCLKNDQKTNSKCPFHWLLLLILTVISSIFAYAVCSGFHLLTLLLTCSALLVSTFALPLLRANPTTSERNTNSQLSNTSSVLKEREEEEEPIIEEATDICDPDPDCSDGSISDEESLIEIALPSGYYIDPKKHEQPLKARCGIQQKWWADCYSIESFQQQNLMADLLAEINEFYEEENMIEIDLSMGSIKYPRFEVEA